MKVTEGPFYGVTMIDLSDFNGAYEIVPTPRTKEQGIDVELEGDDAAVGQTTITSVPWSRGTGLIIDSHGPRPSLSQWADMRDREFTLDRRMARGPEDEADETVVRVRIEASSGTFVRYRI
jgi:hypothetical protein